MSLATVAYARRAYKSFSRSARHILQLIASHQNLDTGWAYVGYDCLAEESSLRRLRVIQLVAFLEEQHALEVRRGHGRGHVNFYRLLQEEDGTPVPVRLPTKVKSRHDSDREKVSFPPPPPEEKVSFSTSPDAEKVSFETPKSTELLENPAVKIIEAKVLVGCLDIRAKDVKGVPPSTSEPTAPTSSVESPPVNGGRPTRPMQQPTNQPDPLARPSHNSRQAVYQAILNGGWRVFLPWASARELEALIASGPTDPSDPLYMPMQLARWIDSNRVKGADFHLGPLWREHFTTRWMAGARSRFLPSLPPPDPEAVAEAQAQRIRGTEARASNPVLREAVKAAKEDGAVLMARGYVTPEAWRTLRRALDQAEDLAAVEALRSTL